MNRSYSKQESEVFEELEADHVYILMKKDNRISRNFRAQWYFNNLNKIVQFQKKTNWDDCKDELEIISIIPKDSPNDWDPETSHLYQYRITPSTVVTFLAYRYRLVFCLDLSPSIAVVEIQRGEVLFDEVFQTLKKCLEGLTKPFCVPGSLMLCQPQVYITVIAHSPIHVKKNEQVLVQGWLLTQQNLDAFLEQLHCQLLEVEDYLAEAAQNSFDYLHNHKLLDKAEDISLEESIDENLFIPTTKPDTDFINLLRYGILSLYLLPENSCGGIIVISDGIISLRDINMLDTLLMQLRNSTTSCSFLQLGSHYHPHCCKGFVPYVDLMQFIATATYGAYLPIMPEADQLLNNEMNCYHRSFFTWSFQKSLLCLRMDSLPSRRINSYEWTTDNSNFFYTKEVLPLRKKHKESNIPTSLDNVLSCRLREGYIIKEVVLKDNNHIQIVLVLFWRHNVNIEYTITSLWPTNPSNQSCHYEITIEGNYEFLHDVTCPKKEPFKSIYRTTVVKKYLALLQGLSQTDQILVHLQSFANNSINYETPESIKRGMPLFNLPPNSTVPDLYSSDFGHGQFQNFWKTVCMLDINIWQKWMHTHRIGIVLEHDQPMPKYLHLTNSLGRYQVIQCRQAMAALTSLLTEWSSFVLIENHSYIKFNYNEQEKPPVSFYIIRLTSKPPCMVIKLAFLGGMQGKERNKIVSLLTEKILSLTFPQRPALKENPIRKGPLSWQSDRASDADTPRKAPLQRGSSQINCCVLMMKPVETILIRYEKMPTDFLNSRTENIPQSKMNVNNKQFSAFNMFTMLSHYLHHRRWIWSLQNGPFNSISPQAVARVLGTLVKMRLQEGFTIAHSHSGILNLVMEVKMKSLRSDSAIEISRNEDDAHYCVIQYVLFPPHTTTTSIRESVSEEEDGENEMETTEADGELQLISECWVEPLTGVVTDTAFESRHFEGRTYKELAKFFYPTDLECISSIVTFEHLSLLCQNKNAPTPVQSVPSHGPLYTRAGCSVDTDSFIQYVPFSFDIMKLLPRCQQSELLFSTYIQSLNIDYISVDVSGEGLDEVDTPNQLLMELIYENLAQIHDREIYLTPADNEAFPVQVSERERDTATYPLPFLCSHILDSSIGTRTLNEGSLNAGDKHSPKIQSSTSFSGTINDSDVKEESTPVKEHHVPHWKCFVKAVSSTHLILTFIPASFSDLKLLNLSKNPDLDAHTVKYIFNDIETELSSSISSQKTPTLIQSPQIPNPNEDSTDTVDSIHTPKKLSGHSYPKGSITLPLYVYDCPLAGISNQLIYKNPSKLFKDNFYDLTFKHELEQGEDTVTLKSETQSSESSKQPSPEPRSEESSATNRRMQLQQHCDIIEMAFSKCFVVGIFRSLHLNHHIHKYDVQSAVDNICEESLLEVDITNFIQTVCGHLKDFKVKSALEQLRLGTQDAQIKSLMGKPQTTLSNNEIVKEVEPRRGQKFPLTLLQLTQTCEDLQQLHVLIKEKFSGLLSKSFLPVSANPDYFFYCPPNFQRQRSKTDITLDDDGEVHSVISDDEHETETFRSETVEFRSDQGSTSILSRKHSVGDGDLAANQETGTRAEKGSLMSLVSNIDSESMASYIGDDIGLNEDGDDNIPPLFIHLTCTVRVKNSVGSFSIRSLPTCLGEIVNCLENPGADLDLAELQVTLDIICLTLPPDMDLAFTEKNKNLRTTSFCSTSPTPADHSLPVDEMGSARSSDDEFPSETQGDQLSHLPIFQHNAVTTSIEEIKWMLRDEIASAMLDSVPLTESTLDMVASHVHSSPERPGCVIEEVRLQFVFGAEQSLDKFIQEFRQMALTGYHLNQEGAFYYLVRNTVTSQKRISCSSQPSLSLARKFLIVQTNPHADDGTELRKIGTGTNEVSMLTRETDKNRDDVQMGHLNAITPASEGRRSPRRSKHYDSVDATEEDTETEDGCKKVVEVRSKRTNRSSKEKDVLSNEEQAKISPSRNSSLNISEHEANGSYSVTNERNSQEINNPCILIHEDTSAAHSPSDNLSPQENNGNSVPKSESSTSLQLSNSHNGVEQALDSSPARKTANLSQVSRRLELSTPFSTPGPSDVSSLMGSGQCSNTEDGYDGDSSDSDNECDWLNDLDTRCPQLPKFWLILKVFQDRVNVYFHVRDPEQRDEQLLQWKDVYRQVIRNIKNICKVVNQSLLLQDLHETRMCNRLLEPEAVEDIWKHDDLVTGTKKEYQRILSTDDPDLDTGSDYQDSYLKANLDFMPGAFSCNIVWQTHFVLHPRLKTGPGPGRSGVSRGIQALRTVLNAFSVNNRVNMFVYQESSGSVFYLRLNESQCPVLGNQTIDSAPGSCSSSLLALPIKKSATDGEEELSDSRPRVNSVDRDSLSVISRSSGRQQKMEDSIQLLVHGIAEASYEIKKELVEVLQNRLDEAVLDVISITLTRNPMCKLTPEDVQFIQKPQELPKTIQFTVHAQALPYLPAVSSYLRQNLLQFLHIPKYIDSKTENHFQDYTSVSVEDQPLRDSDMFLYTRSRSSGNIGIACLTFSIVDGQGNPVQHIACSKPFPAAYKDGISEHDFDSLTSTELYVSNSGTTKHPGPVALIQFRIWERGKLDFDHLSEQLKNAVRHAFWDVVMEYHLLTAPLSEVPPMEDSVIYSEPATPVKGRRQTRLPNTALVKERVPSPISLVQVKFRELSSSVPDIIIKSRSPLTSPKETTSAVKVYNSSSTPQGSVSVPNKKEPEIQLAVEAEMLQSIEKADFEDKTKLHPVYSETMQRWLDYACVLSVPSIKKHTWNLVSRYPIDIVLYEFQSHISNIADMSPKTFYKVLLDEEECYVPYTLIRSAVMPRERKMESSPEESPVSAKLLPGSGKNFIMIGCDENQRRASVNDELITELFPVNLNANKGNQKYPPVFQSTVSLDRTDGIGISSLSSSTPASATTPGNSSLTSNPLSTAYSDSSNTIFIPRQRLLFITVNNKEICLYMYNWAKDPATTILKSITRLVQWHNARSSVLTSIITQKLGLFHNQDFARKNFKNKSATEKDPQMNNPYISSAADVDSLIKYVAPPHRESAGNLGMQRRSHHANHFTNQTFLDILKDNKPSRPIQKTAYNLICDPVLKHGNQIQEIRHMDHKEQQKKLCTLLQISGSHGSTSLTEDLLQLFKQVARLEHYCLTPLLFMPQWRWQVAAARDHTIQALPTPTPDLVMRSRHNSGSSIKGFADLKGRRQSVNLPIMQSMQSSPKTLINRSVCEEVWYTPLCSNYIHEFTEYLQNLGFAPVQIRSMSPKRSMKGTKEAEEEIHNYGRSFAPPIMGRQISNYYMQKSHLGGLIILELSIIEPYFCVRMYILETARIRLSGPFNSQFTLGFLDDCDKLKVLIHLHSFTYDYHLRSIHSYISGRQLIFRQGYHLTSFLEDFVKYYQKSPSFSWNLIYQGILTIPDTSTPATQLYNYLLTHDKLYGMCVLRMIPVHQNDEQQKDNEYVLVQLTTQKVTYKDINETRHTDDFDVSLLISHDNSPSFQNESDRNVLSLKFYIILTSRRELYPRVVEEKKLGKFRTITTATPVSSRKVSLVSIDRSELERGSTPCSSRRISLTSSLENSILSSTVKEESSSAPLSTTILSTTPSIHIQQDLLGESSTLGESQMSSIVSRNHLGIRQEAVNYLGYFSTTEEMMNQIMLEQAKAATERIRKIIDTAMVHCRRDSLWQRLLVGVRENDEGRRKKDDNKDLVNVGLAYSEFTELLKLITIKPLNDIDNQLLPFLSMHISWYQSLVRVLINKYTETQCRHFVDPDGNTQHVAVLNPNFLDTFMLFSVEPQFNRATLCAAFREPITPSNLEHTPERPSFQGQAYQSLVEGFVNACCFHLWSCML